MYTTIPEFSLAGLIAISVLLGLYLLGLWTLAIYACIPAWTPALDSFAILRIGARLGDHIPLKLSYKPREIAMLDHLPGWVGEDVDNDTAEDELGRPARLAVSSERRLRSRQLYECYPGEMGRNSRPTYVRQTRASLLSYVETIMASWIDRRFLVEISPRKVHRSVRRGRI